MNKRDEAEGQRHHKHPHEELCSQTGEGTEMPQIRADERELTGAGVSAFLRVVYRHVVLVLQQVHICVTSCVVCQGDGMRRVSGVTARPHTRLGSHTSYSNVIKP